MILLTSSVEFILSHSKIRPDNPAGLPGYGRIIFGKISSLLACRDSRTTGSGHPSTERPDWGPGKVCRPSHFCMHLPLLLVRLAGAVYKPESWIDTRPQGNIPGPAQTFELKATGQSKKLLTKEELVPAKLPSAIQWGTGDISQRRTY